MILDLILDNIVPMIYLMDLVLMLALFVLERSNPSRALFWMMALLLLPVIGVLRTIVLLEIRIPPQGDNGCHRG